MCGFVAIVGTGELTPRVIVERMRDRLAHRGPDGAGFWEYSSQSGGVSFGSRRLAIQDIRSVADQPMISSDGDLALVFNGEIYNFRELRRELTAKGSRFRSQSDTEVMLEGYRVWGEQLVDRLNGMFAFAIWDLQRSHVFIARDRFGEKPLFMAKTPGGKRIFASEIKAILAHPDCDDSYATEHFQAFVDGFLPYGTRQTFFRNVVQVDPATCLTVSVDGQIRRKRKYWSLDLGDPHDARDVKGIANELEGHLERSIEMRSRADTPVGSLLSGGLDSSVIAGLLTSSAAWQTPNIPTTFSAVFPDDKTIDEGSFINQVLDRTGLSNIQVEPRPEEWIRDIRQLLWHHEFPVAGPSNYLEWCVMALIKQQGFKVALCGQGADELMAGYSFYFPSYQLDIASNGKGRAAALRAGSVRDALLRGAAANFDRPERRFLGKEGVSAEWLDRHAKQSPSSFFSSVFERYPLGDDVDLHDALGFLKFDVAINLLKTSLPANLHSGDRNSMAHGVEIRYPYLDYELAEFCLRLPSWSLFEEGFTKAPLRRISAKLLPSDVSYRVDKVGFAAPEDQWWINSKVNQWLVERVIDSNLLASHLSKSSSEEVHSRYLGGDKNLSYWFWRWANIAELVDMRNSGMWKTTARPFLSDISKTPVEVATPPPQHVFERSRFFRGNKGGLRTAWIISYTPVAKEPRVRRQASTLICNGWRVVVFGLTHEKRCPREWHFCELADDFDIPTNPKDRRRWNVKQMWSRVIRLSIKRILQGPLRLRKISELLSLQEHRLISQFRFRKQTILEFLKIFPDLRPDLILPHDYFTIDAGQAVRERVGSPLIADIHEYALGQYQQHQAWVKNEKPMLEQLQNHLFRNVDGITVVCDGIAEQIKTDHPILNLKPIRIIRSVPFYSGQQFQPCGDIIKILYHGEIYASRGLHHAVKSIPLWRSEFRLILRGYCDPSYVAELKELARNLGVSDKLQIEDPVDFEEIIPSANLADVGYFVHENISPQRRFTLPNKFFEYIAAGLALVVSDLPEMAKIVRTHENGILVPSVEPEVIAVAINSLTSASIDSMKKRSLVAAESLNWEKEQAELKSFYSEAVS